MLAQAELGARDSSQLSYMTGRVPSTWVTICFLSRHISCELNWKPGIPELRDWMLVLQTMG